MHKYYLNVLLFFLSLTLINYCCKGQQSISCNGNWKVAINGSSNIDSSIYYHYTASYNDEIEATLDYLLYSGYSTFQLYTNINTNYGIEINNYFQLSLANHNLIPRNINDLEVDAIIIAFNNRNETSEFIINNILPLNRITTQTSNPNKNSIIVSLSSGCNSDDSGNFNKLFNEYNMHNIYEFYCISLLPHILNLTTISISSNNWYNNIMNDAIDNPNQCSPSSYLNYPYIINNAYTYNINAGPFVDSNNNICNKGIKSVWFHNVTNANTIIPLIDAYSNLQAFGTSSRSICGAPTNLLQENLRSIVFGQSAAFTGTAKQLGTDMRRGILDIINQGYKYKIGNKLVELFKYEFNYPNSFIKYFNNTNIIYDIYNDSITNELGNTRIILLSYNDNYEAIRSASNTYKLITYDKVFGLIGYTGTPTSISSIPIAGNFQVPFICPYTGSRALRVPVQPYIVNIRSSYDDEIDAQVNYLSRLGIRRISIFWQRDSFGQAGKNGLILALQSKGLKIYSEATYEHGSTDVVSAVNTIINDPINNMNGYPQAILMIGVPLPLVNFIQLYKSLLIPLLQPVPIFLTVSFVGTKDFANLLSSSDRPGVIISQVIPRINDNEDWVADEGRICANLLIKSIQRLNGQPLSRLSLLASIYGTGSFKVPLNRNTSYELGPYSNNCNTGGHQVYLSVLDINGKTNIINNYDYSPCGVDVTGSKQKKPLVFIQTTSLTGVVSQLGYDYTNGLLAAFHNINKNGGINDHYLQLVTKDDQYLPDKAVDNAKQLLLEYPNAISIIGTVGTAPTTALLPILTSNNISLIAPVTGARLFRHPFNNLLINIRASYDDELEAMVKICMNQGREKIGIIYQDDGFGLAGYNGLKLALDNRNLNILTSVKYDKISYDILPGLNYMIANSIGVPGALICIGVASACANFIIQTSLYSSWSNKDIIYFTISFAGAENVAQYLTIPINQTIYSTNVVPPLYYTDNTNDDQYNEFLSSYRTTLSDYCPSCVPSFSSIEGYMAGLFVTNSLLKNPTLIDLIQTSEFNNTKQIHEIRRNFISNILHDGIVNIGSNIRIGPLNDYDCNQGLHEIYVTKFNFNTRHFEGIPAQNYIFNDCGEGILKPVEESRLPIVFAQSAVFSGIAGDLGTEMRRGILAAFNDVNLSGGIRQQKLLLYSMDDFYEPVQTVKNVNYAINQTNVYGKPNIFAFLGSVGTPTTIAIMGILSQKQIPLIGAFTGSMSLRSLSSFQNSVVNIRASYNDEAAAIVSFLIQNNARRISVFHQDDSYGQAGIDAVNLACKYNKLTPVSYGKYTRNTINIASGLASILNTVDSIPPNAIITIGTAEPSAVFIREAKLNPLLVNCIFFAISFTGSESFAGFLVKDNVNLNNIYISEIVETPFGVHSSETLVYQYQQSMKTLYGNDIKYSYSSFGSLEGYLSGLLSAAALQRASNPTRSDFLNAIYQTSIFQFKDVQLGPYKSSNTADKICNQGGNIVTIVKVNGAKSFNTVYSMKVPNSIENTITNQTLANNIGSCGVSTFYLEQSCPSNTEKRYINPNINTAYYCDICLPGQVSDGSVDSCRYIGQKFDGDKLETSLDISSAIFSYAIASIGSWVSLILVEQAIHDRKLKTNSLVYYLSVSIASLSYTLCAIWSSLYISINQISIEYNVTITYSPLITLISILPIFICTFISFHVYLFNYKSERHRIKLIGNINYATSNTTTESNTSQEKEKQVLSNNNNDNNTTNTSTSKGSVEKNKIKPYKLFLTVIKQLYNKYTYKSFIGNILLFSSIVISHIFLALSQQQLASITYNTTILSALIVGFILISLSEQLFFHLFTYRTIAAFLMALAIIIPNQLLYISREYYYNSTITLSSNYWSSSAFTIISSVIASVTCFILLGLQFSRLQLSRSQMELIIKRLKKEMNNLELQNNITKNENYKLENKNNEYKITLELIHVIRPLYRPNSLAYTISQLNNDQLLSLTQQNAITQKNINNYNSGTNELSQLGILSQVSKDSVNLSRSQYLPQSRIAKLNDIQTFLENYKHNNNSNNNNEFKGNHNTLAPASKHISNNPIPDASLLEILNHHICLEIYKDFATKEVNNESCCLWIEVEKYKECNDKKLKKYLADNIVTEFIMHNSIYQVNISSTQRLKIISNIKSGNYNNDLFNEASNEMLQLMRTDVMPRFIQTQQYIICLFLLGKLNNLYLNSTNNNNINATNDNDNNNPNNNPGVVVVENSNNKDSHTHSKSNQVKQLGANKSHIDTAAPSVNTGDVNHNNNEPTPVIPIRIQPSSNSNSGR